MKAGEAYRTIKEQLEKAGVDDAGFDADQLLRRAAGRGRLELDELDEAQWAALRALAGRRAQREPLQYIVGHWAFLGLELAVGPGVLIPRPETEEVCLAAAGLLPADNPAPAVLDLCAGSGALGLGIRYLCPQAQVTAVELDEGAFGWLQRNVQACAAGDPPGVQCVRADALVYTDTLPENSLDLIVCNPPYVTAAEYEALAPELRAEPRQALVPAGGEADGLLFYRRLSAACRLRLKPGGALVYEIGSRQGPAVRQILAQNGYQGVEIRQDLAGHDRIAIGLRAERRPVSSAHDEAEGVAGRVEHHRPQV